MFLAKCSWGRGGQDLAKTFGALLKDLLVLDALKGFFLQNIQGGGGMSKLLEHLFHIFDH